MAYRTSMKDIMLKKFFNGILALFATGTVTAQSEPLKILFIGNSYTHMNNMPKMFEKISKNAGMDVLVEKSAQSGASFHVHSEREDMFEAINKRQWDYVILQGYSRELTFDPEYLDTATIPFVNQITDSIFKNNACTNLLFYMTWGYDEGFQEREEVNTYEKMASKIESGYRYLSDTYDIPVVPVGMAWKKVKAMNAMDLYADDRAHPSKEGSFLVASTFFESIFGIQSNKCIGIVREKHARKIRQAVNEVLEEKRALYKLDRFQINLETAIIDPGDDEKMIVEYAINYPEAKSIMWTFERGETRTNFSGIYEFKKHGKYKVQVDIVTGCGDTRSYNREILFVDPDRHRRRKDRNKS
ncbi:MAG: hypothetical protein HRT58_16720 [Crocinitomicaceae bacterium]|nr:hypothetical protein [Flavobacteriales bacterium]NQZ37311.1 hypothetical protein [Crocinitomicaceae bacterium]